MRRTLKPATWPIVPYLLLISCLVFTAADDSNPALEGNSTNVPLSEDYPLDGLGITGWVQEDCMEQYERIYQNSTEYDKLGSAAATTIMAFIPTLLAFGPLKMANLRMLLHLNGFIAFGAAIYTFGLPVEELVTLKKENVWSVEKLFGSKHYERAVGLLSGRYNPSQVTNTVDSVENFVRDIQNLYAHDPARPRGEPSLYELHRRAIEMHRNRPRKILVFFLAIVFHVTQVVIGFVIVYYGSRIDTIAFVWACMWKGYSVFTWWFWLTLAIVPLLRILIESPLCHAEEVLHLTPNPSKSVNDCPILLALECVGRNQEQDERQVEYRYERRVQVPGFMYRRDGLTWTKTFWQQGLQAFQDLRQRRRSTQAGPCSPLQIGSVRKICQQIMRYIHKCMIDHHPMVIILRPSPEFLASRNPIITFCIGYMQLLWLGFISAFFGSTVYGSFFLTLAFVVAFMTAVALGRALGLALGWWLENGLDVVVIEYNSSEEQNAVKVVLCSAGLVDAEHTLMVQSRTGYYQYLAGYRVTSRPFQCTCNQAIGDLGNSNQETGSIRSRIIRDQSETLCVGGWAFEIVCILIAALIGAGISFLLAATYGTLWSLGLGLTGVTYVTFSVVFPFIGYQIWREGHTKEGLSMVEE